MRKTTIPLFMPITDNFISYVMKIIALKLKINTYNSRT